MTTTDETKRRAANAKVTFAGDGASDLADPSFIAKADATSRVMLLIGKAYRVTCPMPFALVGKSNDEIEESWEADGAALWLRWPVSISSESEEESSTDDHGLARIAAGEELSTDYTDYHGLTRVEAGEDLAAKSAMCAKADDAPLPQDTFDLASSASFEANDISALSTPLHLLPIT